LSEKSSRVKEAALQLFPLRINSANTPPSKAPDRLPLTPVLPEPMSAARGIRAADTRQLSRRMLQVSHDAPAYKDTQAVSQVSAPLATKGARPAPSASLSRLLQLLFSFLVILTLYMFCFHFKTIILVLFVFLFALVIYFTTAGAHYQEFYSY
jgi:hypothetical protein